MLPLLTQLVAGYEYSLRQVTEAVAHAVGLTDEDRRQLPPSSKGLVYRNRATWTRTCLGNARVIEPTQRAQFRITDKGRVLLANDPS